MFILGISLVPFRISSMFHEQVYWNPKRITRTSFGIEDIIFCFPVGSLVWFFCNPMRHPTIVADFKVLAFLLKFAACTLLSLGIFLLLNMMIFDIMVNIIILQVLTVAVIGLLRNNIRKFAIFAVFFIRFIIPPCFYCSSIFLRNSKMHGTEPNYEIYISGPSLSRRYYGY